MLLVFLPLRWKGSDSSAPGFSGAISLLGHKGLNNSREERAPFTRAEVNSQLPGDVLSETVLGFHISLCSGAQ